MVALRYACNRTACDITACPRHVSRNEDPNTPLLDLLGSSQCQEEQRKATNTLQGERK